jgi:hypothetical protein
LFSLFEKLRLGLEIIRAYAYARRALWRKDLREALGSLRQDRQAVRAAEFEDDLLTAMRLGRAVSRTLNVVPFDSRCLVRSLVLTRMLSRRGIDSSFVIGVRSDPEFGAHAWVESDGIPLLPPGRADFARLTEL